MHTHILMVGGRWEPLVGRYSKLFSQFVDGFRCQTQDRYQVSVLNGGTLEELHNDVFTLIDGVGVVVWMPDIPNDEDKLIEHIKSEWPQVLLVGSKRLDGRGIGLPEVVQRMLAVKMNLGVIIDKVDDRFRGRVIDPLGNCFGDSRDFHGLGYTTASRVDYLLSCTRVRSQFDSSGSDLIRPEVPGTFLSLIRQYAATFDGLIPRPQGMSRFLGNASFRCTNGFPAYRSESGFIMISRRNIDKSEITSEGFVPVKPYQPFDAQVKYYDSAHKPSVDTPINLLLFHQFPEINFLIHGHVYVEGGVGMTGRPVPCGAIEEFEEIMEVHRRNALFLGHESNKFVVNLKGHGFIAGGHDVQSISNLKFKPRPVLEPA